LFALNAYSQKTSLQQREILNISHGDTIQLDSLSIMPSSFIINFSDENNYEEGIDYTILYSEAKLIWKNPNTVNLSISFRVFPFYLNEKIYNKDFTAIQLMKMDEANPFSYQYRPQENTNFFETEGIDKQGSISRGVSFGNSQDVVLNSNLDLQLTGELSDGIEIKAAITDNNIPIQPQGNTQQIEDFDKVFIELTAKRNKIIAGDFEISSPQNNFMRFNKKAQGAFLQTSFLTKKESSNLNVNLAAAISKGKSHRQEIKAIEGNLGPYKLEGADNENYIIILAGTEKVYIDGRLLSRGLENDYSIDYNTAEITFTTSQMITKDSRIIVEFEYSDKNYSRSLIYANTEYSTKNASFYVNFFNEQDMKNQSLQQELTNEHKFLMSLIGDSLHQAVVPAIDSIPFTNDYVLYKMIDSLSYDSVFVYSTNPDSAHYKLRFSFVGEGNGNYLPQTSAANGKVYKWIAPIGNQAQGSYEAIVILYTPQKMQLITAGGNFKINKELQTNFEIALSNKDLNSFSSFDNSNNQGFAAKIDVAYIKKLKERNDKKTFFKSKIDYEFVEQNFNALKEFRNIEFSRDWNLEKQTVKTNEQILGAEIAITQDKSKWIKYNFNYFNRENQQQAQKNNIDVGWNNRFGTKLLLDASLMQSENVSYETFFLRNKMSLEQEIANWMFFIKEEQETNRFLLNVDSLGAKSFSFFQWDAGISYADTNQRKMSLAYGHRKDKLPLLNQLQHTSKAENLTASFSLMKTPSHRLSINAIYRNLEIIDTNLTEQQDEQTILGRLEHSLKLKKGLFSSSTFYEIGNGMEVKKEFTYIEVPAGQGVYVWTDYNENGIQELNEFDIALFQDQANFIRIFTPTNDYIRTYTAQFREVINIQPAVLWSNEKGIKKLIARFSNRMVYRADKKTVSTNLFDAYSPLLYDLNDSTLLSINSAFRNTVYFNKSHSVFGIELDYQKNRNKVLLMNGFESRSLEMIAAKFRWNISRKLMLDTELKQGEKINESEYFNSKNYGLSLFSISPKFTFQPGTTYRISFSYMYSDKENRNTEKAQMHDIGIESKWNMPEKGNLMGRINYISIGYNAEENTSLAYEMLNGLKAGNNITINISYQRNLGNNMQLSLMYDARKSESNKMVHLGSMQLRAYF
jgi:hypothetical protein